MTAKVGRCIHFNGIQNEACKAGVNYRDTFDGKAPGMFCRMPCSNSQDRRGHEVISCALYQDPTHEQIAEDKRETEKMMRNFTLANAVAQEWRTKKGPFHDRHEIVECPVCKGKLHLQQSGSNGHVHGACETAGCVRWIE